MEELKKTFRPEFLNRIDDVIVFHSLEEDTLQQIVTLMAEELRKRLKEQDIDFVLTEAGQEIPGQGRLRSHLRSPSAAPGDSEAHRRPSVRGAASRYDQTGDDGAASM